MDLEKAKKKKKASKKKNEPTLKKVELSEENQLYKQMTGPLNVGSAATRGKSQGQANFTRKKSLSFSGSCVCIEADETLI